MYMTNPTLIRARAVIRAIRRFSINGCMYTRKHTDTVQSCARKLGQSNMLIAIRPFKKRPISLYIYICHLPEKDLPQSNR